MALPVSKLQFWEFFLDFKNFTSIFAHYQNSGSGMQEMKMAALTQEQIDKFWTDGVLVVEDAVSAKELADLRQVFEGWLEESRSYSKDYGETLDGRPRFDLQPGHNSDKPALRRAITRGSFRYLCECDAKSAHSGLLRRLARP